MKTGIITFHAARNYGAVLQAYALQHSIQTLGCECNIINYENEKIFNTYKIKKATEIKSIKELVKWTITAKTTKNVEKKFSLFREKYYNISKEKYTKKDIKKANSNYDYFFVGSDQVWNFNLNGDDKNYYLDFVDENRKKNSYAASFGYSNVPKIYENKTRELLKSFNNISVREIHGQKIIDTLVEKESQVVIDPTLLLKKEQWYNMCERPNISKDYIFVYQVAATPTLLDFARKLAKEKKCEIICMNNSYEYYFGMKNIKDASPEEFLGYLKYAKYVITSSFHGLAFSVNFEKKFFYELDAKKGNNNSRLENLAKIFGVTNREIMNGNNNEINKSINYSSINKILNNEREKSIEFLRKSININ